MIIPRSIRHRYLSQVVQSWQQTAIRDMGEREARVANSKKISRQKAKDSQSVVELRERPVTRGIYPSEGFLRRFPVEIIRKAGC